MVKISACLVVHNEQNLIDRCLKSINNVVDEIILVHDGSCQDKTLEIAKRYGARIFERDRLGNAELHRPFSFKKAKYSWILQIDADEHLSKELKEKLHSLVNAKDVDAYACRWNAAQRPNEAMYLFKPILFRKSKLFMVGLPHHNPQTKGVLQKTNFELKHEPEISKYLTGRIKKRRRVSELHAKWLWKDAKEIDAFNYHLKEWPKDVQVKKKLAFLYPFSTILLFFWFLTVKKQLFKGIPGLRVAYANSYYNFWLYYFVWNHRPKK